jgi:hypothetical protein
MSTKCSFEILWIDSKNTFSCVLCFPGQLIIVFGNILNVATDESSLGARAHGN